MAVMEKTPETQGRYRYLVHGAITASASRRKIGHAIEEGYPVAALLGRPDPEKSALPVLAHRVVIFEKPDSSDFGNM